MTVQVQGRTELRDTQSPRVTQNGSHCGTYDPFIPETFHLRFLGPSRLTETIESKSSEKVGLLRISEKGQVNVATSLNVKLRSSHLEGYLGRVLHTLWYKVTRGNSSNTQESKTLGMSGCPRQTDPGLSLLLPWSRATH